MIEIGKMVQTRVRVLTDPEMPRGTRCKVIGFARGRGRVIVQGPEQQIAFLVLADVMIDR